MLNRSCDKMSMIFVVLTDSSLVSRRACHRYFFILYPTILYNEISLKKKKTSVKLHFCHHQLSYIKEAVFTEVFNFPTHILPSQALHFPGFIFWVIIQTVFLHCHVCSPQTSQQELNLTELYSLPPHQDQLFTTWLSVS